MRYRTPTATDLDRLREAAEKFQAELRDASKSDFEKMVCGAGFLGVVMARLGMSAPPMPPDVATPITDALVARGAR